MKRIKILFTSIGRRVELVEAFRNAAKNMDIDLKIYGADVSDTAPALYFCDEMIKVCRIDDENYISNLYQICNENNIDALIPTIDTDLLLLSKNKEAFRKIGTCIYVSDVDAVAICRDKRKTEDFFQSCGLNAPKTYEDYRKYSGEYPAFIKPMDGSSSIDAYKVNVYSEMKTYGEKIEKYVIQPFIDGTEYTVDIFCNYDGSVVYITPRERMAVRSGEVLKTRICQDDTIIKEMQQLIAYFKPCGQITVQLIRERKTGINYYIEINPRFGGGAPLSMKAGADSAKALLLDILQEKLEYQEYAALDGAIYCRFDQSICVQKGYKKNGNY